MTLGRAYGRIDGASLVPPSRRIDAGDGMSGGGDLSADRTLIVDATVARTPATIVRTSREVNAGAGLSGGGDLSGDRTLSITPKSGAMVKRGTNFGTQEAVDITMRWDSIVYQREHGVLKFFLGFNFTFATTDVDTGGDDITEAGHGFDTGDGPFQFTTTGTLPAGLSLATDYWAIRVDANQFQVATSLVNALALTQINITSQGSGTHTCDRDSRLVVPDGVTMVRLDANIRWEIGANGARKVEMQKNNADFAGGGRYADGVDSGNLDKQNISSALLEVVGGDYFTLVVNANDASTPAVLSAQDTSWFAIEAVEFV